MTITISRLLKGYLNALMGSLRRTVTNQRLTVTERTFSMLRVEGGIKKCSVATAFLSSHAAWGRGIVGQSVHIMSLVTFAVSYILKTLSYQAVIVVYLFVQDVSFSAPVSSQSLTAGARFYGLHPLKHQAVCSNFYVCKRFQIR